MPNATELQAATVKSSSYTLVVPTQETWDEMIITVDVSATVAPTTLMINYQVSPDGGTTWTKHLNSLDDSGDHINFTTANETRSTIVLSNPGEFGRLDLAITGTSYTTQIWVEGRARQGRSGLVQ